MYSSKEEEKEEESRRARAARLFPLGTRGAYCDREPIDASLFALRKGSEKERWSAFVWLSRSTRETGRLCLIFIGILIIADLGMNLECRFICNFWIVEVRKILMDFQRD